MLAALFKMTRPKNIAIAIITLIVGFALLKNLPSVFCLVLQSLGFAFAIGFANIQNDILDLESDKRSHRESNKKRPSCSGRISLSKNISICMAGSQLRSRDGRPLPCHLDNIVSVVDVARLADEFAGGQKLLDKDLEEEDIANLLIQQIEFCNTIVMNKVDSLSKTDLEHVKAVVRALQPEAKMIETNYGKVEMKDILDTKQFDFEKVGNSAAWAKELMKETAPEDIDDDHDEHEHHHHDHDEDEHEHHHHDHDEHDHEHEDHSHCDHEHGVCHCGHHHDKDHPHGDEYGISTFVYERRRPLIRERFEVLLDDYPTSIIRTKGLVWFEDDRDNSFLFEQAGKQASAQNFGPWFASENEEMQKRILRENPDLVKVWDDKYGDRIIRLVFIGQHMDKKKIIAAMDSCLGE